MSAVEGPKDAPTCDSSGAYVGMIPGHRCECADCGKRIKVVKDGYLARHRATPSPTGEGRDHA